MELPKEKRTPKRKLWDNTIFLFGVSKIGKSTLVSELEDNLFINTGGGLDALSVYEVAIPTWKDFLKAGALLVSGEHNFKVITIDTVDRLHKLCVGHMMEKLEIIHPQDVGYGKAYDMIKDEFMRPLMKLALSPLGLIMISHVKDIEITTKVRKFHKSVPTLQNYVWEMVDAMSGIIWYMTSEIADEHGREKRVLKTSPSENYIAGDRSGKLDNYGDIEIIKGADNWGNIQGIFDGTIIKK